MAAPLLAETNWMCYNTAESAQVTISLLLLCCLTFEPQGFFDEAFQFGLDLNLLLVRCRPVLKLALVSIGASV